MKQVKLQYCREMQTDSNLRRYWDCQRKTNPSENSYGIRRSFQPL